MFKVLLTLAMIGTQAFAVETERCPEKMRVAVPEVLSFSRSYAYKKAESLDKADFHSIDYFISGYVDEIQLNFQLVSRLNSRCSYQLQKPRRDIISTMVIYDAEKDSAMKLRYYLINENVDYVAFAKPMFTNPIYNFSGAMMQFNAFGSYRQWNENVTEYILVGRGLIE